MRTSVRTLLASLAAAGLLAGCGGPATARAPAVPWAQATAAAYTATYSITGNAQGTAAWVLTPGSAGSVTVQEKLTLTGVQESDTITLAGPGLAPTTVTETARGNGTSLSIQATVAAGKVTEAATVNGRAESVTVAWPADAHANVVLLPSLSMVPLASGEKSVVTDVILKHAQSVPLGVSVGGRETVTVPAGSFSAYPVTLTAGGQTETAWYATAAPHLLLQYENGSTTWRLVSWHH